MNYFFRILWLLGLGCRVVPLAAQPVPLPAALVRPVDSLRRLLARPATPDTARLRGLLRLADLLRPTDSAQTRLLAQQALALARHLGRPAAQTKALLLLAKGREAAGNHRAALALLAAASQQARRARSPALESRVLTQRSEVASNQLQTEAAVALAIQALRRAEGSPDSVAVALAYYALGKANLRQRSYPAATQAFAQELRVYEALGDMRGQGAALNRLGIVARDALRLPEAARYFGQAVARHRSIGDSVGVAGVLVSLGVVKMRELTVPSAKVAVQLLRRAERIFLASGYQRPAVLADLYSILAVNLNNAGQPDAGLAYARRGLHMARLSGDLQEVAEALEGLGVLAYNNDKFKAAYEYEHQAKLVDDTLQSTQAAAKMAELQTQYETEKKETRNRLQAAQLVAQRQVLDRRNGQLLAGSVIAALLLGLGGLLVSRRRLRREVEFAQERQALDRQRAAAVLAAEEAERHRIGADLHDGIGQLLSVVKINLNGLCEELRPRLETAEAQRFGDALDLVDESVREVRGISHNLLPNALIKRGLARAVREFLDKLQRPGRLKIRLETLGLDAPRLDPTVESTCYRVIQELVQNIVKHAQATEVEMQIIRHAHELTLLVEDNGVGFDVPTHGASDGVGLQSVGSRVAYLGGTLHVDSRIGRGTTVTATVPV